jgi:hypothetical protein
VDRPEDDYEVPDEEPINSDNRQINQKQYLGSQKGAIP